MPAALIQPRFDLSFNQSEAPTIIRQHIIRGTDIVVTPQIRRRLPKLMLKYSTRLVYDISSSLWAGNRVVDVARKFNISASEVVRYRGKATRIMQVLVNYEILRDRRAFIRQAAASVPLTKIERLVFEMFFSYHGVTDIHLLTGMTPGNTHRVIKRLQRKLSEAVLHSGDTPPFDPFYLNAFNDFRHLGINGDL